MEWNYHTIKIVCFYNYKADGKKKKNNLHRNENKTY